MTLHDFNYQFELIYFRKHKIYAERINNPTKYENVHVENGEQTQIG